MGKHRMTDHTRAGNSEIKASCKYFAKLIAVEPMKREHTYDDAGRCFMQQIQPMEALHIRYIAELSVLRVGDHAY